MGIETALLGTAATAATATSAGTVATAGLIGSGGALFGISGLTASAIGTGFSVLSGLSGIMGGMSASSTSSYQADLAMQQATLAGQEEARLAHREASAELDAADEARRAQKVAYLASGVDLSGSPLLVMEETTAQGQENADEILQAGAAAQTAAVQEGRLTASSYEASGRKAMSAGISSSLGSFGGLLK